MGKTADIPCQKCGGDLVRDDEASHYICQDCGACVAPENLRL